jgi:chromosome segregation ATPase
MWGVSDDIEERLTAAAEALRQHQAAGRYRAELAARMEELSTHVAALREEQAGEQRDVDRLEGLSLARVLASLRGSRDDALARERAEADAARYRAAEAEARLDALRREHDAVVVWQDQLASAPQVYAEIIEEKERHLAESTDPRGVRLLELAEERGQLGSELHEVGEAVAAATVAQDALSRVRDRLASASGWSTYDTFFGGGLLSSAVKHNRLDEAAAAAAYADQCLVVLRTELADVGGVILTAPDLPVDGLTRFIDVWFDNIFTDLAVRDRIKQAQQNINRCVLLVEEVEHRLDQHTVRIRARLADIEAERHRLLAPH